MEPVLFGSAFAAGVGLFEVSLKEIAKIPEISRLSPDDLAGSNYIEKSKMYLVKVLDLDLSEIDGIWQTMRTYAEIRNRIVHHQNHVEIKSDQQSIYQKIKKFEFLEVIDESDEIAKFEIVDAKFVDNYCGLAIQYLSIVIEKIRQKMVQLGTLDDPIQWTIET